MARYMRMEAESTESRRAIGSPGARVLEFQVFVAARHGGWELH